MSWKVYVIHFNQPYRHAKHYTGIAKNIKSRMREHASGNGARLLQVLKENNIGFKYSIIKEFPDFSSAHTYEKYLKTKIKKPQRYCPICKEQNKCKHKSVIGDNYGETCQICRKILSGYGYGSWFGNNIKSPRSCIHNFLHYYDNLEICIYCQQERLKNAK